MSENPISEIQRLLGPCVLLKCIGKKPFTLNFPALTVRDMSPAYLYRLRDDNVGVLLGRNSSGLCVLDFDDPSLVQPFLELNPHIAATFQTEGRPGRRGIWLRFEDHYPGTKSFPTKEHGGFRSHDNQSVVWGIHPNTKAPYRWIVPQPVLTVRFDSLRWPEQIANWFSTDAPLKNSPLKGAFTNGTPPYNCVRVVAVASVGLGSPLSVESKAQINRAVEIGESSTRQNNAASFRACLALLEIRNAEDLRGLSQAEQFYFAQVWYDHLRASGRTNPTKPKTHYFADIFNSVKNAKRKTTVNMKNPIPEAWILAQTKPLPTAAEMFAGDRTMQRLIALCYQMHLLTDKGAWFLARNKVGSLMGLDATQTRDLSENFNVLVGCGILEVVTPHQKGSRQATIYRFVEQAAQPEEKPA